MKVRIRSLRSGHSTMPPIGNGGLILPKNDDSVISKIIPTATNKVKICERLNLSFEE